MASVAMLIGDALVNTLAFTGSSYLFHRLSVNSIDAERARHNVAIEQLKKNSNRVGTCKTTKNGFHQ